jgi:deoxyhypusine synthase
LSEYLRIRGTGCYCCFSWRCDDKNRRHIVGDRIKALLFQHKNGRSFKSTVAEIYETEEKRNDFFARFASDVTSNKKQRTD